MELIDYLRSFDHTCTYCLSPTIYSHNHDYHDLTHYLHISRLNQKSAFHSSNPDRHSCSSTIAPTQPSLLSFPDQMTGSSSSPH